MTNSMWKTSLLQKLSKNKSLSETIGKRKTIRQYAIKLVFRREPYSVKSSSIL